MHEIELVSVSGNIGSIRRAFERLGVCCKSVKSLDELSGNLPIVLPGVGSFGALMNSLESSGLDLGIRKAVDSGTPYLGVCVGMQVLFKSSEESPQAKGLGIIPGKVVRFNADKVPQIGWNLIKSTKSGFDDGHVYFVNSYYAVPEDASCVLYYADYFGKFCAAIDKGNITAYQFHPEKSMEFGQNLLRRWIDAL